MTAITSKGHPLPFVPPHFAKAHTTLTTQRLSAAVVLLEDHFDTVIESHALDDPKRAPVTQSIHWVHVSNDEPGRCSWQSYYTAVPFNKELRRCSTHAEIRAIQRKCPDFIACFWISKFSPDIWTVVAFDIGGIFTTIRLRYENGAFEDIRAVNHTRPGPLNSHWHASLFAQHIESAVDDDLPLQLK